MSIIRIGLISDTHGLLRPEAFRALEGVDRILHTGDIGHAGVLADLERLAPLSVIRGNNDTGDWARHIPETLHLDIGGIRIYLLHDLKAIDLDPRQEGIRVVVAGHSHRPNIHLRDGVLFVNPGSAGPRRFRLPISVGFLEIAGGDVAARIHELDMG